jgi:hypothetical protein
MREVICHPNSTMWDWMCHEHLFDQRSSDIALCGNILVKLAKVDAISTKIQSSCTLKNIHPEEIGNDLHGTRGKWRRDRSQLQSCKTPYCLIRPSQVLSAFLQLFSSRVGKRNAGTRQSIRASCDNSFWDGRNTKSPEGVGG